MQMTIIKQLLHPPQTNQSLRAHAVVILHYSLLLFMLSIVSISFFWILDERSQMGLLVNGSILSSLLLSFAVLQRGHVNLAGHIVIWSLWGILLVASFQNRGIYDPAYGALIIPLSLCAVLLSLRLIIVLWLATAGMGAVLVLFTYARNVGTIGNATLTPWAMWTTQFLVLSIATFVTLIIAKALERSLANIRKVQTLLLKMNDKIAQRERFYRSILDDQQEFIIRWDDNEYITFANQAYCEYVGQTLDDLIGAPIYDYFEADNVACLRACVQQLTPAHPMATIVCPVSRVEDVRWLQWTNYAFFDDASAMNEYQSIGRNVTASKDLEASQSALELAQAREAYFQVLLGDVSHDIKTPLSIMRTSLYLTQRVTDLDKRQRHLDKLGRQVDIVETLIDDILAMSRLTQRPQLHLEAVNPHDILADCLDDLAVKIEHKRHDVIIRRTADPVAITCDKQNIQRVFINLLENAVRYTPADGCITITTEADRETFRLTVADDGIGIDDDAQAHIFDQFYRAESARYIEGGTGLGLSIVKRIVELHQGAITVESELNVGTSFTITLPRELPL